MGKKAREAVEKAGLDAEKLIDLLNKAYCDEWLAHYQYWIGAKVVKGIPRAALEPEMTEHAADELKHAGMLAERIIELGGTPAIDPDEWKKLSTCGYSAPLDPGLDAVLEQNIQAERCAIDAYAQILDYVKGKDMVTANTMRKIMQDEMEHEQDLEDIQEDIENFKRGCGKK